VSIFIPRQVSLFLVISSCQPFILFVSECVDMCLGESDIAGMNDADADVADSDVAVSSVTSDDVTQLSDAIHLESIESVHRHSLLETTNGTVIIGQSHSLLNRSLFLKDRQTLAGEFDSCCLGELSVVNSSTGAIPVFETHMSNVKRLFI